MRAVLMSCGAGAKRFHEFKKLQSHFKHKEATVKKEPDFDCTDDAFCTN